MWAILDGGWGSYKKTGYSVKPKLINTYIKNVSLVGKGKVKLTWNKAKGATGYYVYRKKGTGSWKLINTVKEDTQTYTYDTITQNVSYQYKVRAFVDNGTNKVLSSKEQTPKTVMYKSVTKALSPDLDRTDLEYCKSLTSSQLKAVKAVVKKFCENYITTDMDDIEKLMVAQEYLGYTTVYGTYGSFYNAYGPLVQKNKNGVHEATCYGYSHAMQALCAGLGIPCKIVHPLSTAPNPSHLWVMVKIKNKWYFLDPQGNANSWVFACFLKSPEDFSLFCPREKLYDISKYPTVSKTSYSEEKLAPYYYGYKFQYAMVKLGQDLMKKK